VINIVKKPEAMEGFNQTLLENMGHHMKKSNARWAVCKELSRSNPFLLLTVRF
jgi:hypothetical protein